MNKRRLIDAEYRMNIQDPIIGGLLSLLRKKFNIDFQMHEASILEKDVFTYWLFSPVMDDSGQFYIHQFPEYGIPIECCKKARMINFLIALLSLDEFKPLPEDEVLKLAQQVLKSPDTSQG